LPAPMVFNSLTFAVFFLVVYGLYLATQGRLRVQNALLLAASYVFYGWWDWRFLSLLGASTLVDYLCARWLDRRGPTSAGIDPPEPCRYGPRTRRAVLIVSLVTNLGMLGVFKYFDFFAASAAELLRAIGLPTQPTLLHVILPVGISFYTFQSLSYTIDVYRGRIRAEPSLLDFALYVAFFPQLVAGPILRASEFLPQLTRARRVRWADVCEGGFLIFVGLFKKVFVADNLATVVDRVFSDSAGQSGGAMVVGVYAFAVQIYCDFSGYTDIARGCGRMMGFEMPVNFNLPYLATNPVDFWRRWHISLSTWLRDYLYIPLGGNRKGCGRTYINLMITMLLGGLWHGAAWTFVAWGAYQGLLLVVYKALQPGIARLWRQVPARLQGIGHGLAVIGFFQLVCVGWLIFRASTIEQAWFMLDRMMTPWPWYLLTGVHSLVNTRAVLLVTFAAAIVLMDFYQHRRGEDPLAILRLPALPRSVIYAGMFFALVWYGVQDERAFIYFQF
jgi:D-alanyl-lipoteichoic acid acyltransferase DltB (MBOAT superfamily)